MAVKLCSCYESATRLTPWLQSRAIWPFFNKTDFSEDNSLTQKQLKHSTAKSIKRFIGNKAFRSGHVPASWVL